ncbi:tyrosine-type recombinase/integrase [Sulfitobacter sp. JB4-11]|uniref:tyrosine-type recombinase/integrase n=1 Tax=Sulfitobacter rhodophyticola TaxID=3238304 RepID=UPI0035173F92
MQYRRQKTESLSSVLIDIPVHPELRKVIDELPRDRLTFLETRDGRSRTANGLGNAVRKWCDDAGLPKCSAHRLRKACATRLAEAGATEREIMAWTGHNSPTMVQVYAGRARRGLLADHGFEKLIKNERGSKVDEPNKKGSTK